jgi:phosphoribosyl 1,2-cyclic phosphate phosphodiesterase
MQKYLGGPLPIYCTEEVESKIRTVFAYAFTPGAESPSVGYVPKLIFERISIEPFTVLGQKITPIPLRHAWFNVLGFRIGDIAYCTDVSLIPEPSWDLLKGLRVLVLDALRYKPHAAHFSVDQALEVIDKLKPEQAYLTHLAHELEHETVNAQLPKGVELAYDGLKFDF